jgi:hypothetical protein
MDPLHPLVPIQPPAPTPPNYNRVQRVQRDPQEDSGPDWQGERGRQQSEQEADEQFEDDYDPDWSDPAAVEPYGADGVQHENAAAIDLNSERELKSELEQRLKRVRKWNPRADGERRAHPRAADDPDDDDGPDPEQHIDISA